MFGLQAQLLDDWRAGRKSRPVMSGAAWMLVGAGVLVVLAGVLAMADAALADVLESSGRRPRDRTAGAERDGFVGWSRTPLRRSTPPCCCALRAEIAAVVLVAVVCLDTFTTDWQAVLVATGSMLVVSFVVIGVAPRTLGRQHAEGVALALAGPLLTITRVLGPLPRLLIVIGNALTPGEGFREGPFATEAELRELVDLAEAGRVIESGERKMIHSVFELGDTIVREVMVPRTDIVFIEANKTLRHFQTLALRSGFSRIPVVGRRRAGRHRRYRVPQGRRSPALRQPQCRVGRAHRVGHASRLLRARLQAGGRPVAGDAGTAHSCARWSSTSTAAPLGS